MTKKLICAWCDTEITPADIDDGNVYETHHLEIIHESCHDNADAEHEQMLDTATELDLYSMGYIGDREL